MATLNGTYSKAVETGAPVQGPQSEDIAERALNACKDHSIKEGMTEEEVIAVLGQPSHKENDVNGYINYYYGTSECNVELAFNDSDKLFYISDNTYGAFEEEW